MKTQKYSYMKYLKITPQNTCNKPQNFLPVLELAYFETNKLGSIKLWQCTFLKKHQKIIQIFKKSKNGK